MVIGYEETILQQELEVHKNLLTIADNMHASILKKDLDAIRKETSQFDEFSFRLTKKILSVADREIIGNTPHAYLF